MKRDTTRTNVVKKYSNAPPTPNLIPFPTNEISTIPSTGTDEPKQAPNKLMLNTEKSHPILTNDTNNDTIYINMFFFVNTFEKIFNPLFTSFFPSFTFIAFPSIF